MKNTVALLFILVAFLTLGFVKSNGNSLQPEYKYELVANVTDGEDDTYDYYVDMQYFKNVGIQLDLDGGSGTVTVTVEATLQDDGTAQGSCAYVDVTEAVFGEASFTADAMLLDDTGALSMARYLHIKVVASTGDADDADWTIRVRKIQ